VKVRGGITRPFHAFIVQVHNFRAVASNRTNQ
jgi:hypothetical protein